MSVANEVRADGIPIAPQGAVAEPKPRFWQQRAFYRYGFVILLLALWEVLGPLVNPILFSYPSKIAVAFYELTVSGELPYYAAESLEILFFGLVFAILVGVPLAVLMARVKPVDWALDWPINALYSTPMVALVPLLV